VPVAKRFAVMMGMPFQSLPECKNLKRRERCTSFLDLKEEDWGFINTSL